MKKPKHKIEMVENCKNANRQGAGKIELSGAAEADNAVRANLKWLIRLRQI